ncbi:hypothetical protein E4U14_000654 [Claviceps sp. LM454 group G7]|nr:hypothetical protein E4U14_000654 [Claviceps sp. LM454 group G7]
MNVVHLKKQRGLEAAQRTRDLFKVAFEISASSGTQFTDIISYFESLEIATPTLPAPRYCRGFDDNLLVGTCKTQIAVQSKTPGNDSAYLLTAFHDGA